MDYDSFSISQPNLSNQWINSWPRNINAVKEFSRQLFSGARTCTGRIYSVFGIALSSWLDYSFLQETASKIW